MPAYRVRFLVEFVVEPEDVETTISDIVEDLNGVYDVTSVAYGDLEITDPDAEPNLEDEDND